MGKQGRRERKTKMPQWQEDDSASLLQSTTRAGTAYLRPATKEDVKDVDVVRQIFAAQPSTGTIVAQAVANAAADKAAATTTHALHDEDPKQTVEVIACINAERKLEQLSTDTAALTVANAAAMKAAAGAATFQGAAAEQAVVIDVSEKASVSALIQRLHRLLTAERAATAAARAAADEAAATINNLEMENKRLQHLLAAENAAKAANSHGQASANANGPSRSRGPHSTA